METNEVKTRTKGRPPGPPTVRALVLIEEELLEWAKTQPGGFSQMVRELVREKREQVEKANK